MKTNKAFTLIELLVVVAVLAMLSCLLLPVLAHSRGRSAAAGCLSNMRQLMAGWSMYREENNDILMPNAPLAYNNGWIPGTAEDWYNSNANTNVTSLLSGQMGAYLQSNVRVFKCPADVVPSDNGQRLRSYSMNGQMGAASGSPNYNSGWRQYSKGSDLTCPAPANAFIFCDECPDSLNDGYFQSSFSSPEFPDIPAGYLDGGCGFSFADGHAEIHKWQTSSLLIPVIHGLSVNYPPVSGGINNADWLWLVQHCACRGQ
jgi:prepilin-type N-terminal cleavage/methylation domain-containing protein/prepilin-type processing-associated H-X9-DG protein